MKTAKDLFYLVPSPCHYPCLCFTCRLHHPAKFVGCQMELLAGIMILDGLY